MKEKKECKLVQDLLPNYIEKVTSEDTNQYMEEHLQSCVECEKVYTSMKEEMKAETLEVDKTVDCMKKVNQKIKIAKIALGSIVIIILSIILAFWANTLRNYKILEELRQTLKETQKISSYHVTMSRKMYNYGIEVTDIYKRDKEFVSIFQFVVIDGKNYKVTAYTKENRITIYSEGYNNGKYEKIVRTSEYDSNGEEFLVPYNYFLEEPKIEEGISKLWMSTRVKIAKTTYQGKECYVIENDRFSKDPNEHIIYYIEKDTGLIVRQIQNNENWDYNYEFGNVDDEIFKEPNIEEYELIGR